MEESRVESARRLKLHLISQGLVHVEEELETVKTNRFIDSLTVDVAVSFDGSWKDRGFTSHHGVVAAISIDTGEVLDVEYLCNHCR